MMPPPVDPGDAPINISSIMTSRPALLRVLKSTVQKPAVRAVMLWKNAAIQPRPSVSCKSAMPPKSSTADLGVKAHFAEIAAAAADIEDDHKADAAHDDERIGDDVQQQIIPVGDQAGAAAQCVKPRIIKGSD